MSDITLKVRASFDEAQKAFEDLANSSDETRAKMEKFSDSFQTKNIDSFIDRQNLLEVSLKGTRGETAAMQQAANNYQKEIERLIKSGLSPNSEAVQKLAVEQKKLTDKIKESNDIQKAQANLMKNAEKAAMACYAAIAAGTAAIAAMTQKTAKLGDELSKTSRVLNISVESLQELRYAAAQSGVKDFDGALQNMNKTMIDVSNDTGNLTKYLKDNNEALLGQLKGAKNNEESFKLLIDAINQAPTPLKQSELAMAAFGKSGRDMVLMAKDGSDGLAGLRDEARKYGIISNETAKASEEFLDAQLRLKTSLAGVSTQLTSGLIPGASKAINMIANFIASVEDWRKVLEIAGYALAGLTAGLTAFLVITKGAAAIQGIATAFKALNAAIAANPIGAIAVVVTAVLIPALIALYRNWDTVQTYLEQGIARIEYAFKTFSSQIKEKFTIAVNEVKIAFISLGETIMTNVLGAVANLLDVLGKLPVVGEQFNRASESVRRFSDGFSQATQAAQESSRATIAAVRAEENVMRQAHRNKLATIDTEARARREALSASKQVADEEYALNVENANNERELLEQSAIDRVDITTQNEAEITEIKLTSLRDRLNQIALTEQQAHNEQVAVIEQFLLQRAQLESNDFNERLAYLQNSRAELLSEEGDFCNERIQMEIALNNTIKKIQQEQSDFERKLLYERINAFSDFAGSFSNLLTTLGKDNRKFAIAGKVLASVEAGINTALAFTKALASAPPPVNFIAAASVATAGIAQQVKIIGTPIPSAETGGRFIVPQSAGVDGSLMRVNSGETVDVTPRGMTNQQENFNFNFMLDGSVFASIINKQAKAGELYTLQLAGNY